MDEGIRSLSAFGAELNPPPAPMPEGGAEGGADAGAGDQ
jgi:hypothetical protein